MAEIGTIVTTASGILGIIAFIPDIHEKYCNMRKRMATNAGEKKLVEAVIPKSKSKARSFVQKWWRFFLILAYFVITTIVIFAEKHRADIAEDKLRTGSQPTQVAKSAANETNSDIYSRNPLVGPLMDKAQREAIYKQILSDNRDWQYMELAARNSLVCGDYQWTTNLWNHALTESFNDEELYRSVPSYAAALVLLGDNTSRPYEMLDDMLKRMKTPNNALYFPEHRRIVAFCMAQAKRQLSITGNTNAMTKFEATAAAIQAVMK